MTEGKTERYAGRPMCVDACALAFLLRESGRNSLATVPQEGTGEEGPEGIWHRKGI